MRFRFLLFLSVVFLGIGQIWGQTYTEDFEAQTALTASYADGSFTGADGVTFTYVHSRNEGLGTSDDSSIDGKGIMLRRADEPSSIQFTLPNGVGNLSFDYRKAFTGGSERKLAVFVNGVEEYVTPGFGSGSGADATVYTFNENINEAGPVTIKITYPTGTATGNKQITIDNISWTEPTGTPCTPSDLTFTNATVTTDLADGNTFTQTASSLNETTAITYESSDELVATVNATTGEVTLVGLGTTTITANQEAGTHNGTEYCAGTATYELTVISTEPVLTVSTNSLSFTAFAGDASATETITVEGFNLTGNIALALSGDTNFSIDPNTLSASGGTITVTYTPSASPATHSATLTVSNGSLSEVIALSGTTNEVPAGPCFKGHAPSFSTSGYTAAGEDDSGGDPITTIRLASSSNGGSVSTTATGVTAGNVTVRFRAKGWNATETQVTVQVGSSSVLYTDLTTSFAWHEVTFSDVLANPTLTFSTVSGKRLHLGNVEIICVPSTPTPQITVTPSGNHNFGNQLVGSTSTPKTFTIANTGNADLTIGTIALSGANADQFSVTQAVSSTVTQGNTTAFTVSFSPTSLGSKTATVTIPNNDEDYTFTVTGTGSYATASDIATNTSYSYTENILYANYQIPTITNTSNSVGVFQFAVRDGGEDNDGDDKPTTLTDISFNYTGTANTIRAAALFNGNGKIADGVVTANGISFSGLNIVAPDNGSSPNITLRVSFTQTVTDKEKLVFTVASATADTSGSVFAQANAGGAFSDNNNTDNKNRIEVVADRLAFATQPSGASVNTNLAAFVIAGVDEFGNTDLDATNTITLTTSGTGMTASPSYTLSNGTVSISDVQFNTSQTGITLTATTTGLASGNTVTSEPFDISDLATGTYRTTSNGTWPNSGTATWERLTEGGWTNATPGASAADLLIIRHTITTNAAFGAAGGTKMIVENGGTFNAGHNSTFGTLTVQNGGVFSVNNPAVTVTTDGTLTVENGGRLIFNSSTLDSEDGLFRGTENFHPESILEIKNWHFDADSGRQNLIQSNSIYYVTPNSAGYHFGHIEVNAPSMSSTLRVIQHTLSGSTVNLCNDFRVLTNANRVILVNSGTNTVIGGNLIVNTASSSQFSFAANTNTNSNATHTVKGDIVIESGVVDLNQTSSNNAGHIVVQLQGNLVVNSGTLKNTDSGDVNTMLNFTGNGTEQTVSTASESTITSIPFNINSGAIVKIINHDFKLGNNSKLTVKTGGTLDFGFNGSTALNVAGYGNPGTGFTSEAGSYLKITSPQGILTTSGSVGNIQVNTAPVINTLGTFHYIGKENQVTGNGIGTSSSGRAVIVDMESDDLVLTPSVSFGITSNANPHINNNNGGILDIRKGRFVETETAYVTGSTGSLKMDAGTYYEIVKASDSPTDLIPRMDGDYQIIGGEINLASTGDQTLRGGKSYFDLTFSNGAIKTVSNNSTPDIEGLVYIAESTTLDVSGRTNNGFGKSVTDLLMDANSKFIVDGADVRPQLGGDYVLDLTSEIEFTGTSGLEIRVDSTPINYAKVVVSGTNVTAGSTPAAGLTFQNGGSFTVKDGATFKVNNPAGFTGSTTASIKNAEVLAAITLEPNSTIEYNGSGAQTITNGIVTTPSDAHYENLRISGSGVKTTALGNLIVNNITYVDAATLRVAETNDDVTPNVLTARKGIQVASGATALFENNANLMQDDGAVNIGDITVERFVRDMNNVLPYHMDYVYWSSPVTGQWIHNGTNSIFSPGTPKNRNYEYHEPTDYFVPTPDQTFTPGKGYAIRAETGPNPDNNNEDFEDGYDKTYTFTGIPNNGLVSIPIQKSPDNPEGVEHGYNLVGNPYPSNIDADVLFDLNASQIYSVIYLWTNNITHPYQLGSSYSGESYAIYNPVGGVPATKKAEPAESGWSMDEEPDGIIKVGQGFIIKAKEGADSLQFQNMYGTTPLRITDKGYFFQKNSSQKDRFWLEQKSPLGMINSTLVGYVLGATNGFEKDYDAPMLTETSDAIYTVIDSIKLRIQGRSFPLELTDVVPLGLNHFEAGVYTIGIRKVDGIFNQQSIYLRDKQKEIVHNLSLDGEYVYETNAGELTDRFEIIFQEDEVMSTSDLLDNSIKIYHTDQNIVIESEKEKILSVEVYDLNGRKVHSKDRINSNLYQIRKTSLATQVFVVKVLTDGGKVETRKIINQ